MSQVRANVSRASVGSTDHTRWRVMAAIRSAIGAIDVFIVVTRVTVRMDVRYPGETLGKNARVTKCVETPSGKLGADVSNSDRRRVNGA